jgi:hypothetical protein
MLIFLAIFRRLTTEMPYFLHASALFFTETYVNDVMDMYPYRGIPPTAICYRMYSLT